MALEPLVESGAALRAPEPADEGAVSSEAPLLLPWLSAILMDKEEDREFASRLIKPVGLWSALGTLVRGLDYG